MRTLWWLIRGGFRGYTWIAATAVVCSTFVTTVPPFGVFWRAKTGLRAARKKRRQLGR